MSRRPKQAILVLVVVFAGAQLVRPERTNPPVDQSRTFQASAGAPLSAVLDRACRDCHSNTTVWPWYTHVAPVSWLMAYGVATGRNAINFSEWGTYSPAQKQLLLAASCADVTNGKMPGPYALLHPETRLSPQDVETICTAARQISGDVAGVLH
jgi:hypothetical protein